MFKGYQVIYVLAQTIRYIFAPNLVMLYYQRAEKAGVHAGFVIKLHK